MENHPTNVAAAAAAVERAWLRKSLGRNLLRGLLLSVILHVLIITGYYANQYLADEDEAPVVRVRLMKYSDLGPPPSITNNEVVPVTGISVAAAKPTVGIPVPVPDMEVSPDQTIATQQELSQLPSSVNAEAAGGNNVVVQPDVRIDDDPAPDAFIPVEKYPVAVTQVRPVYPDLARRAGVEGVVWVKALVDRNGHVKKAIVEKSDSEIFNEPAIAAAMQWVFTPAMMANGPVSVWVAIPFRFRIDASAG